MKATHHLSPSEQLLELLIPEMVEHGFEFKKSKNSFVRKFGIGEQRFVLSFRKTGFLVCVYPEIQLCFYGLEKAYSKIFSEEGTGYKTSKTLLSLYSDFHQYEYNLYDEHTDEELDQIINKNEQLGENKIPYSVLLSSEQKIKDAYAGLMQSYKEIFKPLFAKFSSYDHLENHFNENPGADCLFMHWPKKRISLGLILGHYLKKRDLQKLIQEYRKNYTHEEYLQRIDKIEEFCKGSDLKHIIEKIK